MYPLAKEKLDFLNQTDLLYGLTKDQLTEIALSIKETVIPPDTYIIKEHEVSDEVYVIWEGGVEVHKTEHETGNSHQITMLGKGAVIGEISLLDSSPRSASVRTTQKTTLLVLSISALQKMRHDPQVNKQLLYFQIIENLAKNTASKIRIINDVVVDALERELVHTKARVTMGLIIISVCFIMSFYVLAFEFLKNLQFGTGLGSSVLVVISSAIVITAIYCAIKNGCPASLFGLTIQNWRQSVKEAILFSIPILILLTVGKWLLIHYSAAWHGRLLFELFTEQNEQIFFSQLAIIDFFFYLFLVPFQELIVRGAVQSPLQEMFINPHKKLLAIIMSNLLFSVTHTHLSLSLALPVFLLGLFWGWLYSRTNSLVGVITSHWLIGIWAFFIINIRPTGVG